MWDTSFIYLRILVGLWPGGGGVGFDDERIGVLLRCAGLPRVYSSVGLVDNGMVVWRQKT